MRAVRCGVVVLCAGMILGCQPSRPMQGGRGSLPASADVISAERLAERLGLTVAADSGAAVVLRDAANCVTLRLEGGGQADVNGRPAGPRGGFVRIGGVLFVPAMLEEPLRAALRPLPPPAQQPVAQPPAAPGRVIVIDPGHGGKDCGAVSPIGLEEKSVVLPVGLEVARLLREAGHAVILTRDGDVFLTREERAAIANRREADLFVSIHADSAPNPDARGFTVYVCRGASAASRSAADAVAARLDADSGLRNRGVRTADYDVLVLTRCPAILVELGYLSNRQEALLLRQDTVQAALARCIASAIDASVRPGR
ncbi:MAG: N-acetylmuramoyl-L-alanine amidase [Planctomycetes bacterium]|nr:N-acetylmuramoyl-L-alanine amidase [Planctomycetota bacterium]